MLLEHLLALPAGTEVSGEIVMVGNVAGRIESREDGSRFIQWADGCVTVPLGRDRHMDEYIAAHTHFAHAGDLGSVEQDLGSAEETNRKALEESHAGQVNPSLHGAWQSLRGLAPGKP